MLVARYRSIKPSQALRSNRRFSLNSLKWGLTAGTLVLPHEDVLGYQETRGMLYTQYQPATPQECMLVHLQIETLKRQHPEKPASPVSDRQALAIERAFYRALNTLEKVQATRLRREAKIE